MKSSLLFLLLFTALAATAQKDQPLVKFVNPSSVAPSKGYSQASAVDLGNCTMLIISGQVPLDKEGNLVGKENFALQATQVFSNIKAIVEDQGGRMDELVKINYYISDIGQLMTLREIRNKFVNLANPPASTLVQVSQLYRNDVMLEVEATAIIPKKK